MFRLLACALLVIWSFGASASGCAEITQDRSYHYMVNVCNQTIGPIHFCWESRESDCSCYKGAGCSAGPLKPGRREMVSGPGRDEYTSWNTSYCVYDEWVANRCRPKRLR